MKLLSLRIEQFRQFRTPIEISGLNAGINLFVGPNESGKSTLANAIRAAFFERHKSNTVEDFRPWGDSSASPTVELSFEWNHERWHLQKRFLKTKRCDLAVNQATYSGDEAEEKLAALLGFQLPTRGSSKTEHWGIPGLLWIEQGSGQEVHTAVRNASNHLKSALGDALGEIASSSGDALLQRFEKERATLLTTTGRPTKEYLAAIEERDRIVAELAVLDDKITLWHEQVDRLNELNQQRREDAERPWETLRKQANEIQLQLNKVENLRHTLQREQKELEANLAREQTCSQQLTQIEERRNSLSQREKARDQATLKLLQLRENLPVITQQLKNTQRDYYNAKLTLQNARQAEQQAQLANELAILKRQSEETRNALNESHSLHSELFNKRTQYSQIKINAESVKKLRVLYQNRREIEITQKSIATRIRYSLNPGKAIAIGNEILHDQGERHVSAATELTIEGIGRISIEPGGKDLAEQNRQLAVLQEEIQNLQTRLQTTSLEEAEHRADQSRALENEIRLQETLLRKLAPQGIEALQQHHQSLEQQTQALSTRITELSNAKGDASTSEASGDHSPPMIGVSEAESYFESANNQLKAAEQTDTQFSQQIGLAQQAMEAAQQEWQRLHNDLHSAAKMQEEQNLQQRVIELRTARRTLEASILQYQQKIEAERPDILQQDIARFTQSATVLEQAARTREHEHTRLQASLEVLGAQGLEEERANLHQKLEFTTRRHKELERKANALSLLIRLLQEKRQKLTRQLQAPLQRHIQHYLQLLFPQAELRIDEDLLPQQLSRTTHRGEEHSDFDQLSFGAREQMALISRLAYADLLKAANHPTLIILDDALVHSDKHRLQQMKRVLFDAAQRHQILLFSCHPENWQDLGVAPREMNKLLQAASGQFGRI
ncbi:Putative GTP-binding protein [gamma proteobacterium HdN1]|nr:Putative GTP-binding protein [gamma proteobacterium HdN1]